ncbi:MAG: ASPIC/UnbV domain-containing protein, partial [Verrucomicrobia bacterium]|nr:ASPIC/UnbV domain-containing protein [Verrucomicrobiota bacterium]
TAEPGIRMRLVVSDGIESAIGAVFRAERGGKWGAARELKSGSGYWSQDSAVQIIAASPAPTRVMVRWPGTTQWRTNAVPAGAKEFTLGAAGQATVVR